MRSENCVALGHARLKILDLSNSANQPLSSDCCRYEIVFNGEIYNFRELRNELSGQFNFRTTSDTEVLLNLYRRFGIEMLERLNGMFAFAIYDHAENSIFLARDRFGIKPLYYALKGDTFIFSSEIKPILSMMRTAEPDMRMISTYLNTSHCDFGQETFFEGVRQIPSGCQMTFDLNRRSFKIFRWYSLQDKVQNNNLPCLLDIKGCVSEALQRAVERNFIADVQVGLNISGGVDSAILIDIATQKLNDLHSYTQDYKGYSERPWVKETSRNKLISTHFVELSSRDILSALEDTVFHQEQPFGGVAVIGYSFLYSLSKKYNTTVLLDGNGIDEAFLGYKKYHIQYLIELRNSQEFNQILGEYCHFWGESRSTALSRIALFSQSSNMIDGTPHSSDVCMSDELSNFVNYDIPNITHFKSITRNSALRDLLHTKIPRGLRFNDRMSMMHSRELRVPFLDHELVELAYSIPIEQLITTHGTKSIIREVLASRVDPEIAFAPKRSIQTPQNDWIGCDWREFIEDILFSPQFAQRGWIDSQKAQKSYENYLSGNRSTSFYIWQWINLELWARMFFDRKVYL